MTYLRQTCSMLKLFYSTVDRTLLTHQLRERGLVKLSGRDAAVYLQGLITNDMRHLENGAPSMYAMFLNSKGRVMYDSIVYKGKGENTFLIECDSEAAPSLKSHLLHFKVRRKIDVDLVNDEYNVWAVVDATVSQSLSESSDYKNLIPVFSEKLPELTVTGDPRLSNMGLRVIAPKAVNLPDVIESQTGLKAQHDNFYKGLRYKLGIGEGMRELPFEKCFPMEVNGDYMHGISFHKGCYVGQELTARTYHTGVIRKRLMPLEFREDVDVSFEPGSPIFASSEPSKSIGKLYGTDRTTGLGLLRIDEALKSEELVTSERKCTTRRPFWWPTEAPKSRQKIG